MTPSGSAGVQLPSPSIPSCLPGDRGTAGVVSTQCLVCHVTAAAPTFAAREHMFGLGADFIYAECPRCRSLSLVDPPADLGPFYPDYYYSFRPGSRPAFPRLGYPLRATCSRAALPLARRRLAPALRRDIAPRWLNFLAGRGVSVASTICDIGCGNGELIGAMSYHGFQHLTGIDAYLPTPFVLQHGVEIWRRRPEELMGMFDVVMLHHSLEHMADPSGVLRCVSAHLSPGGMVVVRVPVAGSAAWEEYGPNWVQLDPPRHLFVPSVAGFEHLAATAGYAVEDVVFDSGTFQFWGSELCRRGEPVNGVDPLAVFGGRALQILRRRADAANQAGRGDQAAFILRAKATDERTSGSDTT